MRSPTSSPAYAERPTASVPGFLSYLAAAAVVENGLAPADVTVSRDRVQVMTVHAAKGLEWQIVAVPHLTDRIFPSTAIHAHLADRRRRPAAAAARRPLRGRRPGVPVLDTSAVADRKQLSDSINAHRRKLEQRRIDEERRLLYVALTRAEDTLLLSGHHWGPSAAKPSGPSDFLTELKDIIDTSAAEGDPCGVIEHWAAGPADGDRNPLRDDVVEVQWPADPLGSRRADVERGAALVRAAAELPAAHDDDPEGWAADVDALLAERAQSDHCRRTTGLPPEISVSTLVEVGRDPVGAAQRLVRRLPARPDPNALLGTAFHEWVQRFYGSERLFDLDDLPGAVDEATAEQTGWPSCRQAFCRIAVGIAHAGRCRGAVRDDASATMVVRGRIDAVFADPDGGATVVDWKTGEPPSSEMSCVMRPSSSRCIGWRGRRCTGRPPHAVRAAFHYVRTGRTVSPDALPGADELAGTARVSSGF